MWKKCIFCVVVRGLVLTFGLVLSAPAGAEELFFDDFAYANGTNLNGIRGWTAADATAHWVLNDDGLGDGGTNSLQYPGDTSLDGRLHVQAGSGTIHHALSRPVTGEGSFLYASFLYKPLTIPGTYWFQLDTTGSIQGQLGRIDGRNTGGQVELGCRIRSTTALSNKPIPLGQTALVVMKVTMVPGASNDTVQLWVNPPVGAPEPAADATATETGNDINPATGIIGFSFRVGQSNSGTKEVDLIRFGTTWEDVTSNPYLNASGPSPRDGAVDTPRDAVLSWAPGQFAETHDVYFGTEFADVNTASRTSQKGVLVRQGQDATTYDPGPLGFDQTYYWRVDELNAPPSGAIHVGQVWSFRTEPLAYLITDVQATASSSTSDAVGPANMVDGSGLSLTSDGQYVHDTIAENMWQSASPGLPATVAFEFDRIYKLHQMKVWNHNTSNESLFGLGAKEVTIEIADSNEGPWTPLADVSLNKAPGLPGAAATDTIPMLGVMASNVRLTIRSSHGGLATAGLAEVQFLYIPVVARELTPADGTVLEDVEVTLAWRSGREAAEHQVYLATEEDLALVEGSDVAALAATVTAEGSYASHAASGLNLSQTYVWKVAEVNTLEIPAAHDSPIQSFTTPEYLVVDDMEGYKNVEFMEIWDTWLDGTEFGTKDPTNGSTVGLDPALGDYSAAPGRAGGQSLAMWFTNTAAAPKSEAIRTSPFGDWTRSGIKSLSLWFSGDPANTGGRLYVKINNGAPIFYDGDPADLKRKQWLPFNIDLSKVSGGVSNVTKLAVGVEGVGAKGVVYVDDIRLYPKPGELIVPTEPSADGLAAYLSFDESAGTTAADSSGKGNHGTVMGDAQRVAGKVGGALAFDGVDDIVVVTQNSGLPIYNNGTDNAYSVAMWVKGGPQNDMRVFSEGSTTSNTPLFNMGTHNSATPTGQFAAYIRPDTGTTLNHPLSQAEPFDDTWHHIAWVDENGTARLYVDGHLDGGDFNYTRGTMALNTTTVGGILRATPSYFFTGQIDEVRIYNRALSEGEILGLAGGTVPTPKPF